MTAMDHSHFCWRKSSRSDQDGGNCVEVALASTVVGVRDSKNPGGPALIFPERAWVAFLSTSVS